MAIMKQVIGVGGNVANLGKAVDEFVEYFDGEEHLLSQFLEDEECEMRKKGIQEVEKTSTFDHMIMSFCKAFGEHPTLQF